MLGECLIDKFKCKYHYDATFLYVIPDKLEETGALYRWLKNYIAINETITISTKKSYHKSGGMDFKADKVNLAMSGDGVILNIAHYIERYTDDNVNRIRLTCEEFTKFIEIPSYYFFRLKDPGKLLETADDLLYNCDIINQFDFKLGYTPISATIEVGGILDRGIASDLKLKAYLTLSFETKNGLDFIFELFEIVNKALNFLCYKKDIKLNTIELYSVINNKSIFVGRLQINKNNFSPNTRKYYTISSPYYYLSTQLNKFFDGIANDMELYGRHLPNNDDEYFNYNVIRLINIFSAFENEYNKLPKEQRKRDTSLIKDIANVVVDNISASKTIVKNDEEKDFIEKAIQRVKQIDTSFGEIQKIVNAFRLCKIQLSAILEFWHIKDEDVTTIAKKICNLRDKIVHNNFEESIEDYQKEIAFLEWLTNAMLLFRYNITDVDKIIKKRFGS